MEAKCTAYRDKFCVVNCALLQLVLLAAVLGGAAAADTVIVIETRRHAPLT